MACTNERESNKLLSRMDYHRIRGTFPILHRDTSGNEFHFLSTGQQTMLERAIVRTPLVNLPSSVKGRDGKAYPVTTIGAHAFAAQQELKYLIIPEGVAALEEAIFANCGSLLSVVVPASVRKLGAMFWRCPTFEENAGGLIYYTGTKAQWNTLMHSDPLRAMMDNTPYEEVVRFISKTGFGLPKLDFQTAFDETLGTAVSRVRVCEQGGEVTIAEAYRDSKGVRHTVTQVGRSAFAGNSRVQRVIIPAGIQKINQDAFYHCVNLREVVILPGKGQLDIEMGAFFNCPHLEKVYIGRPCRWGEHALGRTPAQKISIA